MSDVRENAVAASNPEDPPPFPWETMQRTGSVRIT